MVVDIKEELDSVTILLRNMVDGIGKERTSMIDVVTRNVAKVMVYYLASFYDWISDKKLLSNMFHLHEKYDLPVVIFRCVGIYGPGRNLLVSVKQGRAKSIKKNWSCIFPYTCRRSRSDFGSFYATSATRWNLQCKWWSPFAPFRGFKLCMRLIEY